MVKKLFKIILYIITSLLSFIFLYAIVAFILSIILINKKTDPNSNIEAYIHTNGVHTDIVLPIKVDSIDWSNNIKFTDTKGNDSTVKYISFGWGDRGFYLETPTWAELKFSTAFKAVSGLSRTAMHVTYYKSIDLDKNTRKIMLSKRQFYQLLKYIDDSFVKDEKGGYLNIKTNMVYGNNDAFYEAKGSYSLFNTCNSWANTALKKCEQKASLWTPLDKGIFYHY